MNGHYFKNDSNLKENLKLIVCNFNGKQYRFYTDSGVFSRTQVDEGSLILLKSLDIPTSTKTLLDLGSGYGPIGIIIKDQCPKIDILQTDVNEKAILLCEKNNKLNDVQTTCEVSDGFKNIKTTFDMITLNPPIRAGKEVVYELYTKSFDHLNKDGSFWIVVRKKQGALSHIKFLETIFKEVKIINKSKGYYVIKCQKH